MVEDTAETQPRVEPLATNHERAAFSCGVAALDRYLHQQAGQDVTKRVAAAFVLTTPPSQIIHGFYTLAATSVRLDTLPRHVAKRLPRYPNVPATLLGRLAVDAQARGRGYGEFLLLDALRRSFVATRAIASAAVLVAAKDETARRFYERYEFLSLSESPWRLFLPMATIAQLFPRA